MLKTTSWPRRAAEPEATPTIEDYVTESEIGRGGMGVVYKAVQTALGRTVALKMVLEGQATGDARVRFFTEAEAMARFQHPNIVQIYEVGEAEGRPFLSLEFVEGGTLEDKLERRPMPWRAAAELVELLSRAVHAAHTRGVVHRDLKPANVLLMADGSPKIADFGIAKRLDAASHTQTGRILGTPSYMALEQALGRPEQVGSGADICSLGANLYDTITGRPPFEADCGGLCGSFHQPIRETVVRAREVFQLVRGSGDSRLRTPGEYQSPCDGDAVAIE